WLYLVVFGSSAEPPTEAGGPAQLAYGIGKLIQFALPIAYVWYFDSGELRLTGPTVRGLLFGFGFGLVVALAMLGLYFGGLDPSRLFAETRAKVYRLLRDMDWATPGRYLLLGVFYAVVHSLLEEYYWRWFAFGRLRRYLPLGAAIALSAIGFTAHHVVI